MIIRIWGQIKVGPDEITVPAIDIDIQAYLHLNSQIKNLNNTWKSRIFLEKLTCFNAMGV